MIRDDVDVVNFEIFRPFRDHGQTVAHALAGGDEPNDGPFEFRDEEIPLERRSYLPLARRNEAVGDVLMGPLNL